MELEGNGGRTGKKRVPSRVGPEGKVYYVTADVTKLKPGETPPAPEESPVEKVPAQRLPAPLKDVNTDDQDWTNH